MANLSMSGDPLKKKKKDSGVADCTDGKCGPTTRGRMSLSRFNPTKSRYNIGKIDKPKGTEQPTGGFHQNMTVSGINSSSGDVNREPKNAFSSFTDAEIASAAKEERRIRKEKEKRKAAQEK